MVRLGMAPQTPSPSSQPTDSWACVGCGHDLKRDPDGRHWDNPIDGRGYCNACWKKREAAPEIRVRTFDCPLTSADRAKLWKDFDANIDVPSPDDATRALPKAQEWIERHHTDPVGSNTPRTPAEVLAALGNPPGWTEANVLGIHTFDRAPDIASRVVTYCEHAPPRELVEATPILLDGNALGAPTLGTLVGRVSSHLCWSQSLGAAWDRHETYRCSLGTDDDDGGDLYLGTPADLSAVVDPSPPDDIDAFGGRVFCRLDLPAPVRGMRCRLCGGWLRSVTIAS